MQSDMISDYNNSLHSQYAAPEQKKESSVPNTVMYVCDFAVVHCDI